MPNLNPISNADLWNAVRKNNPQFASHTAEGTADLFTEKGWSVITANGLSTMNEFWSLAMPFYLQMVNISHAKDPLDIAGFGEYYDQPWGGYIQRMSLTSIKPISPKYKGLANGTGPDPFVVRKPVANQRFFTLNFDYQSMITMPDEFQQKQIFVSQYGMSEFLAGVFTGLENGYIIQKFQNKLEAINAALNPTGDAPSLKASQAVDVALSDEPTAEELKNFQLAVMNTVELMTTSAQTGAYNAAGFESTQDKSRLHLLVRPGYKNELAVRTLVGAFHPEYLNIDVSIDVVPNFGGLKPYKEAAFTNLLYPVYNDLGEEVGFSTQDNDTETAAKTNNRWVANDAVYWKDPNATIVAVLADKGLIFETKQNGYQVEPIRNPRGLYTNYWASSPNNGVHTDPVFNMVKFVNTPPDAPLYPTVPVFITNDEDSPVPTEEVSE